MDIKLARTHISEKPAKITVKKLEEMLEEKKSDIFYCDKENSHKDMQALLEYFEKKGKRAYFREVRYGLDEGDYMYEIHIL
ncbi:HP0268 family nuclease [uncultured Helicobacter sp.]|uniref:HP0268 family nuclease n=1 Tax=uncultured Helicobacter sp. TaxID=175537 RepID=UPI002630373B|nr:HP0268 family nuclease [uncultured Helicobacter sp.]